MDIKICIFMVGAMVYWGLFLLSLELMRIRKAIEDRNRLGKGVRDGK